MQTNRKHMLEDVQHIQIDDYNYSLPDERIAKHPVAVRDHSKLLVYNEGKISHTVFNEIPSLLPTGSLMVFNNTKVIQARLHFRKETGALIEIFCLEPHFPKDYESIFLQKKSCQWECLIGNKKKWKEGALKRTLTVSGQEITLSATNTGETESGAGIIEFDWDNEAISFSEVLDAVGELPIPPYLNRETEESDKQDYQTVYSKIDGSVAAPTAGLHFTDEVLRAIDEKGIERNEITLHVGAGTFKPVKSEDIQNHEMHSEFIFVNLQSIEALIRHEALCIAVGTTSVRTLESLYYIGIAILRNPEASEEDLHVKQWMPYQLSAAEQQITSLQALQAIRDYLLRNSLKALHTSTQLIIAPGYKYHFVRMMVTNFHMPKSTLLLLVSAFIGEDWHKVYRYALDNGFRFLSYGDSSLLIPKP